MLSAASPELADGLHSKILQFREELRCRYFTNVLGFKEKKHREKESMKHKLRVVLKLIFLLFALSLKCSRLLPTCLDEQQDQKLSLWNMRGPRVIPVVTGPQSFHSKMIWLMLKQVSLAKWT